VSAAAAGLTVPAGTRIVVRTIGMASTRSSHLNDMISAVVDVPVVVGARIVIPRGAAASLRVAGMDEGISLSLAGVAIGGRQYPPSADTYSFDGSAGGKPKKGVLGRVGGLVHKKHGESAAVVVPPETRLSFTLSAALEIP
jgi:hypothetical protein